MVMPALREAVHRLPEPVRHVAEYHFSWREVDGPVVQSVDSGGGRAIRPALVLLAAQAVGAPAEQAVPAACAVELVHNFSLVHDDLMDRDPTRRARAACWSVFGASAAILTGDALLALAFDVLGRAATAAAPQQALLSAVLLDMVGGQGADIEFEARSDVDLAECIRMAAGKTGALLGGACALGAVAGGGDPTQVEYLRRFGAQLGLAYQCLDDVLGIWGDPLVTGKIARSDLVNRKKTLPVVATLCSDTPAGRQLALIYHGDGPLSEADVAEAATLIEIGGGRDWTEKRAAEHLDNAMECLRSAGLVASAETELAELALLVTGPADRPRPNGEW
jgi:geranylgeranyl diphosphate synthase type I